MVMNYSGKAIVSFFNNLLFTTWSLCLILNVLYTYIIPFEENLCISAVKPNDGNSITIFNDTQLLYSCRLL